LKTAGKILGWLAWLPPPTRQLERDPQGPAEAEEVEEVVVEEVEAVEVAAVMVLAVRLDAVKVLEGRKGWPAD
jgi:hypothetical protein